MNINEIMEEIIEFRLGLDMMHLDKYYDDIKRMLERKTLRVFSTIIPFEFEDVYKVLTTEKNPNSPCLYLGRELPDGYFKYHIYHPKLEANKIDILGILSVKSNEYTLSAFGDSRAPTFDLEGMLDYAMESAIKSRMGFKYKRWNYLPINMIKLRGFGTMDVLLNIKIPYPNFASIPDGLSEVFLDLAELDTQIYLYNKLKYINNMDTPAGTIDLKIDDWADAKDRRKEFLEELEPEKLRANLLAIGRFEFRT